MAKCVFCCDEVSISHEQLRSLSSTGELKLGIDDNVSARILSTRGAGPDATAANAAGHFWNWNAFGRRLVV